MQVVLVANPKGGVGKSTLATNVAGLLAARARQDPGVRVMLGDVDRQQSSRAWLQRRAAALAPISSWELVEGHKAKPPKGTTHVVIDTPAGMHRDKLKGWLKLSHRVLVPVQASMLDLLATQGFLEELAQLKAARGLPVALVGMRVDERTRAADEFRRFVAALDLPLLTCLRDTHNYVHLAAHGMSLFDLPPARVARDLAQWTAIEAWLGLRLPPTLD